ncbi:Uncharacterized protein PECH_006845 [Penicillium ucsense]|uniref:Tubby C-terminal domain-containing protein n=1 Tax=Penicillium ucsense TaxID=2839758 RepID=A0A8J8W758_9EURO|nr:Uncharacterized protein PECM_006288 [Penicillium ucsense]KAF7735255.1 Uncharacterized protein PECH_006845 [Penicillium ucsense]
MTDHGRYALAPISEPLAIHAEYIKPETSVIQMKEKIMSVSGDSFEVKLASGHPLLKVEGKWVTISGRKKVSDAVTGTHLFDIVKEHLHLHTTYALEDPKGKKIAEVKSALKLMGSKATATFTDARGRDVTLKMKGGWFDHSADIVEERSGQPVARIDRKMINARDLVFGQQTYNVVVAPGVDVALIAALCICFDEKNNET